MEALSSLGGCWGHQALLGLEGEAPNLASSELQGGPQSLCLQAADSMKVGSERPGFSGACVLHRPIIAGPWMSLWQCGSGLGRAFACPAEATEALGMATLTSLHAGKWGPPWDSQCHHRARDRR